MSPDRNPILQAFLARLAALPEGRPARTLTLPREPDGYSIPGVLSQAHDYFHPAHPLPDQARVVKGINYWLVPPGVGLRHVRVPTGGTPNDAFTHYFTLLLPDDTLVTTEVQEDSYQPELQFVIAANDEAAAARVEKKLEEEMKRMK